MIRKATMRVLDTLTKQCVYNMYLTLMFTQVILALVNEPAGPDSGISMPSQRASARRQARGVPGGGNLPAVMPVTINNTTVGVCREEHLCRSLGCHSRIESSGEKPNLCHCDPECVFFDDCCQDYNESCGSASRSGNSSSINLEGFEPQSFSCIAPTSKSKEYLLINGCPKDTADTQTAVRCENPDQDDVFASIPCYGTNNGVHYRNIYCGLCHGEEQGDLIPWEILVDCGDRQLQSNNAAELLQSSISNLNKVENELGCDVIFKVSKLTEDIMFPPRRCHPDVIRHCPTAQDALSDACESYTALTVTNLDRRQLFRNPHCALCNLPNGPARVDRATDCSKDIPVFYLEGQVFVVVTSARPGLPGLPGPNLKPAVRPGLPGPNLKPTGGEGPPGRPGPPAVAPPPISIIFDFRSNGRVQVSRDSQILSTTETVQCSANEVYDPFVSSCRRLSCSSGYLLEGNQCVPDFGSMGQACGDQRGDDDIEIGVTATFGNQCEGGLPSELNGLRDEDVQQCLVEEIPELGGKLTKVSSILSSPDCAGMGKFSFIATGRNATFGALRNGLKISLSISESPLCWMFNVSATWSVEVHQQCENLQEESCNGRWINETEFSISVRNGTTFVYVNASKSWFPLNQAIVRANFNRRERFFDQYTDLQICAEPTLSCPLETLNSSLFQEAVNNTGAVIYTPEGIVFSKGEYVKTENGYIQVCSFNEENGTRNNTYVVTFFDFSIIQQALSLAGNIVSMIAAAATFATYCLFKELRKRISAAIMGMVACLFMAQLLLLLSGTATSDPAACTAVASLGHFFWLSSVLWTSVLAFDLHRTFAYASRMGRLDLEMRIFLVEVLFTVAVAMVIVVPCLVIHLCDCTDIPLWYGDEKVCWIGNGYANLVAFGLPIGIIVLVNAVLFFFTVRGIHSAKRKAEGMLRSEKTRDQRLRQELIIYAKISSLMGFTWIFGFAAAFSDLDALWYIFIILNSCQGLLIFVSFICNKKVWSLWRNLVRCGAKVKGPSQERSNTSTVPTIITQKSQSNTVSLSLSRDTTL